MGQVFLYSPETLGQADLELGDLPALPPSTGIKVYHHTLNSEAILKASSSLSKELHIMPILCWSLGND